MILANPLNFNVGTCGGTLTGTPGTNTFSFSGGSLPPGSSCTLTLSVTMTVNGNLTNTIPANAVTTANGVSNPDPAQASLTNLPGASVSKFFNPATIPAGPSNHSLLTITIQNTSSFTLTGMGLSDILPGALPVGLVIAGASAPAPVNTCGGTLSATAGTQIIQLVGGSLAGNSSCTIVVSVTSTTPGSYVNTIPAGALINDQGASNNLPATDTLTVSSPTGTPNLFDPPFGLKTFDESGLPNLHWTMIWINNSNTVAINAAVSDAIPVGTTYIPSGASSGFPVPGGAPAGSTNIGVSCTDTSAVTTTTLCYYEGPTGAFPRGRIVWTGTLGPDDGATGPANADDELTIVFNLNVNAGITDVRNTAVIDSDRNGDGDISDPGEQQVATASATWSVRSVQLPDTGFAPNVVTDLSNTSRETYIQTGGITVEIPSLEINIPIVGVPLRNGEWNVAWLGKQAGWLQGSAFPSWNGNSVLTSHVYLSNGLPGPFVNLSKLKFGEKVIVHAFGQKYIFEVQTNTLVEAKDASVFKHEAKPWLTLLTCKEYDERTNTYRKRVVVRAVLVDVEWE